MAFPTIAGTAVTNGTSASTSPVVDLPASIAAGDLLIVCFRTGGLGAIGWPAGWTELADLDTDSSNDQTALAYRKADGTEGATITLSSPSGNKFAAIAFRITGHADPATQAPEFTSAVSSGAGHPDPPSLTPTGGAKDYLWLAFGGCEGTASLTPTYPTNYTLSQLAATSGTAASIASNCRVFSAGRELNAAAEDPGAYTLSAADDWTAFTVAIHPAGGGGTTTLQAVSGSVGFTSGSSHKTTRPMAGALAFAGNATRVSRTAIAAALSFAGAVSSVLQGGAQTFTQVLTASVGFTAGVGRKLTLVVAAAAPALSFNTVFAAQGRFARAITAALSFAGSVKPAARKVLAATLTPAAVIMAVIRKGVTATLGFAGSVAGTLQGGAQTFTHAVTASLGFTGAAARSTASQLVAGLSFTSAQAKRSGKALAAALGMGGAIASAPTKGFAAALSFSTSVARRIGKVATAALSPGGALQTAFAGFTQVLLSATLSFSAGVGRRMERTLAAAAATLSFTGSVTGARRLMEALTATLGFAGMVTKQAGRNIVAAIGFTGATTRQARRALSAALGFASALGTTFAGGAQQFAQALTASLAFTATASRKTAKSLTAVMSFSTSMARAMARGMVAGLSFSGGIGKRMWVSATATLSFIGAAVREFLAPSQPGSVTLEDITRDTVVIAVGASAETTLSENETGGGVSVTQSGDSVDLIGSGRGSVDLT